MCQVSLELQYYKKRERERDSSEFYTVHHPKMFRVIGDE